MKLREHALAALAAVQPDEKVTAVVALWQARQRWFIDPDAQPAPSGDGVIPGRPERPRLLAPSQVPRRSPHTLAGRAALLHAICHIEFNAINLALDAVWRFSGMPEAFYRDWLRVAYEESQHFGLLRTQLRSLGGGAWDYGDFDAHDGLWAMCEQTRADVTARMALVPRTLEARGLDATPQIQARLATVDAVDARQTVAILDLILRDEIGHVALGNQWFEWLCAQQGLQPQAHYRALLARYRAPRLKAPLNLAARQQAGFDAAELQALLAPPH